MHCVCKYHLRLHASRHTYFFDISGETQKVKTKEDGVFRHKEKDLDYILRTFNLILAYDFFSPQKGRESLRCVSKYFKGVICKMLSLLREWLNTYSLC